MKILPFIFTDTFCEKVWRKMKDFFENGGIGIVFAFAAFGIAMAVIGHYGKMGFNWKWFLFFELPLYIFLGWAIYKAYLIWKEIIKEEK